MLFYEFDTRTWPISDLNLVNTVKYIRRTLVRREVLNKLDFLSTTHSVSPPNNSNKRLHQEILSPPRDSFCSAPPFIFRYYGKLAIVGLKPYSRARTWIGLVRPGINTPFILCRTGIDNLQLLCCFWGFVRSSHFVLEFGSVFRSGNSNHETILMSACVFEPVYLPTYLHLYI